MDHPKKSLGQHWLHDKAALNAVVDAAHIGADDMVLEVGPGLGTLTVVLTGKARKVLAIELDEELAAQLATRVKADNLEVLRADILKFDLASLPPNYKVVANIPYYLTSHLLRTLSESPNPPSVMSLLVQKEVARRITAAPGQMSLLAVSVQLYFEAELGKEIPAHLFTPPPKVDSQIIALKRRAAPLFLPFDSHLFFRVVKAGFSERRKKLRSSLSGGLNISKEEADRLLAGAGVASDLRAQELNLQDWYKIYTAYEKDL
jgi:16S rRNA (adenine1518-N6/adenine1519-N6)-dimethyltransferase